jgi:17beta-estradiol 17-dehydrogenase/3beta-hydroxysteroid 3-dehydrogenase/mitotic-spindle organizing protein 1
LRKLHGEFERRFQDFKSIELDLNMFSMPFNVDCEQVKPSLQLELIELQFLNTSKLEFYKTSPKLSFPNLICHAQRIMSMFASSYMCEQVFSSMKLRKSNVRNRLTDDHLASLLRVTASQLEPEYKKTIGHSIAVPLVTHSIIQRNKRSWKYQVCRNQGKFKYFIIIF